MTPTLSRRRVPAATLLCALLFAACSSGTNSASDTTQSEQGSADTTLEQSATTTAGDAAPSTEQTDTIDTEPASETPIGLGRPVRVLTYDSFTPSKETLDAFQAATGIAIEAIAKGDTGEMVNTAILSKDAPIADVVFGIDSTFLSRAVGADILKPHTLPDVTDPALAAPVGKDVVVPVDRSEVCVNADSAKVADGASITLDALIDPAHRDQLVVENPASSAPGLAFLLATISQYGEDGWQAYWKSLKANGVKVVNGWDEAWNNEFSGAGKGTRPLVISYSSSPVAAVVYGSDPNATSTPLVAATQTCIPVVEYAGLLKSSTPGQDALTVLEFFTSLQFQAQLPTSMFVYPARTDVELPEVYKRLGIKPVQSTLSIDPERVQTMREQWVDEWTQIVLG